MKIILENIFKNFFYFFLHPTAQAVWGIKLQAETSRVRDQMRWTNFFNLHNNNYKINYIFPDVLRLPLVFQEF
jgi:hypothetical protein